MSNWLEIAVGIFLISMILYGHYKGFIRLAVSVAALIATLVIVNAVMPEISDFLKEKTPVYTWIQQGVEKVAGVELQDSGQETEIPAAQREAIEKLNIPQEIKDILIENNNNEVYRTLGVEAFTDYIGSYLANLILNIVGFLLLFVLVYAIFHLVMNGLDLMARLPILSGINKLAGALLGGVMGLFYLWIVGLVLTVCSGSSWAAAVLGQIEASSWLSFIYHYNLVSKLVLGVIQGIISQI